MFACVETASFRCWVHFHLDRLSETALNITKRRLRCHVHRGWSMPSTDGVAPLMPLLSKGCRAGGMRSRAACWCWAGSQESVVSGDWTFTSNPVCGWGHEEGKSLVCSAVQLSACCSVLTPHGAVHTCSPNKTYSLLVVPFLAASTSQFLISSLALLTDTLLSSLWHSAGFLGKMEIIQCNYFACLFFFRIPHRYLKRSQNLFIVRTVKASLSAHLPSGRCWWCAPSTGG